jgi:peptidoglycan/LPS O-acetylase OafA/YrhL
VSLIVASPILRGALYFAYGSSSLMLSMPLPCRGDVLFMGVLAAIVMRNKAWLDFLKDPHTCLGFLKKYSCRFYGALAVCGLLVAWLLYQGQDVSDWGAATFGRSLFAIFYTSVVLIALTQKESMIARLSRLPFLSSIGTLGYGIYLFHQPLAGIIHGVFLNQMPQMSRPIDVAATLGALIITIALAHFSWHFFEKRFVKIGHKFRYETVGVETTGVEQPRPPLLTRADSIA